VARQAARHGAKAKTTLWVTPGSEQIHQTIQRDGQLDELAAIGGVVLANACGPCIGQWKRDDLQKGVANSILTSFNRNFPKRNDGSADTQAFIASPEIVIAYALAGRLDWNPLTDELEGKGGKRFKLAPPAPAPELPPRGFVASSEGYLAPPAARARIEVKIEPGSERLAFLAPFPAWDGKDYSELPILLKAKGKCTTDHISMAGPWLRFRGHLDKISDNLFIGATNAFTGKTGEGKNVISGEEGVAFPKVARDYKARGLPWVVVGDQNYGEGSSREHAAMEPRWLGGVAVIVRSFARIHETNLKKQGLLPLTFANPADYEKVEENDRVSVLGLAALAPGKNLRVLLHHASGKRDELEVRHTFNAEQVGWFKAGSALNVLGGGRFRPRAPMAPARPRGRARFVGVGGNPCDGKPEWR
jgi:aconitate hydratase